MIQHLTHFCGALVLILATSTHVLAQESEDAFEPYSKHYTGAFMGLGAFAGPSYASPEMFDGAWGSSFGVVGQFSLPLQILDVNTSWVNNQFSSTLPDGSPVEIDTNSISLGFGLHPLFLVHLESSPLYYAIAGSYLLVALDAEFASASISGPNAAEVSSFDLGYLLGGGFDFPIDDVDDGGALWLGFQYRYNQWAYDAKPLDGINVDQHMLLLRFSYRKNGLIWAF